MFSKFRKYMVLAVVSVASLAIVGQAAAVTATPGGAVTGTAGTSQLVLNTARRTLNCTTSTATATLATSGNPLSTNLQPAFAGCRIVGGLNITAACGAVSTLTATGGTTGNVNGTISGISCTISASGTCSVRVTGSVPGNYTGSRAAGGRLTVSNTGQSLAASGSTCTTLPNDTSATFTDGSGNSLAYAITPAQDITYP